MSAVECSYHACIRGLYSWRSACMGSTSVARCAGMKQASSPASSRAAATAPNAAKSNTATLIEQAVHHFSHAVSSEEAQREPDARQKHSFFQD